MRLALSLVAVALAACHLFAGPATAPSADDWIRCEDGQLCHRAWERCSTTRPQRCVPADPLAGAARDAGADR